LHKKDEECDFMMKRLFDFTASFVGLILLAPVFFLTALVVRVKLSAPVLFRQQRPGLNSKPFMIYKFRTMTDSRDSMGKLLPDADRLTRIGKFLRSSSLDELPELVNVIKGDMSLVGPRPLLMRYTPYFTEREKKRFLVLPGITGWAQINGRNESSWGQRLSADVWYVENRSFGLDLKIIFKTFEKVIKSQGVVVDANSIMLDFDVERSRK